MERCQFFFLSEICIPSQSLVQKRSGFVQDRPMRWQICDTRSASEDPICTMSGLALGSTPAQRRARLNACEIPMTWKAPKAVEVSVAMEINIYACASRK